MRPKSYRFFGSPTLGCQPLKEGNIHCQGRIARPPHLRKLQVKSLVLLSWPWPFRSPEGGTSTADCQSRWIDSWQRIGVKLTPQDQTPRSVCNVHAMIHTRRPFPKQCSIEKNTWSIPFRPWPAWLLQHESSTWVICIFWWTAPLLDDSWQPNNIHAFPCSSIVPQTKRNSTLTWPPSFASYTSSGQENKLSWNWKW